MYTSLTKLQSVTFSLRVHASRSRLLVRRKFDELHLMSILVLAADFYLIFKKL